MSNATDRVDMVKGSKVYTEKYGKQPRHLDHVISEELYKESRGTAPKHRKNENKPRHLLWSY